MAGYLKPEKLWKDINKIGLENPKKLYLAILPSIIESGADQDDPSKFNAKLLRKNLFKSTDLSATDASDFILYITQHAFGRNIGQERNELKSIDWMAAHFGIELNKDKPVIIYTKQEDCSKGLYPARHYPNYADGEQRKLTETLMSAYVLESLATIHSESAALLSMRWLPSKEHSGRAKESLFYQTIDKSEFTEPTPDLEENSGALEYVIGGIKSFFDEHLD